MEPRETYERLRAQWRACRCAEHAEWVEEAGRRFAKLRPPPPNPDGIKKWHASWIQHARAGNPLDLTALLDSLEAHATSRHASMIASCLDELTPHEEDPQLTLPLLRLLDVPAGSSAWNKVHTRVFKLLESIGDPRAIAALEPAVERSRVLAPNQSEAMRASLARALKCQNRLAARFPQGVPPAPANLPRDLDAAIAALPSCPDLRPPQRLDEQQLQQSIWENPDDDARRQVYADCLLERGDARGEFIALQLSTGNEEAQRRARRMLEGKVRAWLGPIGKAVIASTAEFERGFLSACETDVRRASEARALFSRPDWATVKRIHFRGHAGLSRQMRSLETAGGVTLAALTTLSTDTLPRLQRLGIAVAGYDDALQAGTPRDPGLEALSATRGLPSLVELELGLSSVEYGGSQVRARSAGDYAWLLESPVGRQIDTLSVSFSASQPGILLDWLNVLRDSSNLRRLRTFSGYHDVRFQKDEGAIRARVDLVAGGVPDPSVKHELAALLTLLRPEVSSLQAGDLDVTAGR